MNEIAKWVIIEAPGRPIVECSTLLDAVAYQSCCMPLEDYWIIAKDSEDNTVIHHGEVLYSRD